MVEMNGEDRKEGGRPKWIVSAEKRVCRKQSQQMAEMNEAGKDWLWNHGRDGRQELDGIVACSGWMREVMRCPVGFNYVSQAWDEIFGQEGRTGCANQHCFFGKLVDCFAGTYAGVTGDPLKSDEKGLMERQREIRFVMYTYRSDGWNWEECLGGSAGTSRVSEDVHSDAIRYLLWKKVTEVLKKGQSFCIKDSVLGRQLSKTIPDIFQQTPISLHFFKNPYFGSLLPPISVIKLTFQFSSHHDNTFKSK